MVSRVNICYICLNTDNASNYINETSDGDVSYYEKLTTTFSHLVFNENSEDLMLCSPCCYKINTTYEFYNKCLISISSYNTFKTKLHTMDVERRELYLGSTDVNDSRVKHEHDNIENTQKNLKVENDDVQYSFHHIKIEVNDEDISQSLSTEIHDNIDIKAEPLFVNIDHCDSYALHSPDNKRDDKTYSVGKCESTDNFDEQNFINETLVNINECPVDISNVTDVNIKIEDTECLEDIDITSSNILTDPLNQEYQDTGGMHENTNDYLDTHISSHADENPYADLKLPNQNIDTSVKLHVCDEKISQSAKVKKQKRSHRGDKDYKCDLCNRRFADNTHLTIHKRSHSGEKPYVCDVCNRAFRDNSNLKIHQRIHSGEKPYVCEVCNRAYADNRYLTVHKRIHSGEKPYICDVCNQRFAVSRYLKEHKRTHTGEKPYICDVCNRGFGASSNLVAHKRIHTGEKPHECEVCYRKFLNIRHFKTHKLIHTGEKPYVCDICNKGFRTTNTLKRHKSACTGEKR